MPTAGKLFGAISLALVAWFVSALVPLLLPEGTQTGLLQPVNAGVGFIMGWTILGRNAGEGLIATLGHASTAAVAVVFWCLVIWSGYDMIERATRLYYDGPVEALQDMAMLALGYARMVATAETIGALLAGTLASAAVTEGAAARWA